MHTTKRLRLWTGKPSRSNPFVDLEAVDGDNHEEEAIDEEEQDCGFTACYGKRC